MSKKKIIVIGGGAAGLTASIFARNENTEVIILERTKMTGKKILISGGTRCNVLPVEMNFSDYFTSSSQNLMKNIFKSWSINKCYEWLSNEIGLKMVTEKESNKWFPLSNSAIEVRDLLLQKAERLGVKIYYNSPVNKIIYFENKWICKCEENEFIADSIIVATGGYSFPQMGTDGSGHRFLKKLGHSINKTYPALTPLKGKHPGNENLAGISLDIELKAVIPELKRNKKKAERTGFLFTHKGFSGPSILDLSHYAVMAIEKNTEKPNLLINWNGFNENQWNEILMEQNKGLLVNVLKKYFPNRLAEAICKENDLLDRKMSELKKNERNKLIESLINYKINYTGHEGYSKAEVTGGGIPLEEIDTSTMESKLFKNLYFCGEILDVFGRIGGFNFYWAWLTGRLSGISVSK